MQCANYVIVVNLLHKLHNLLWWPMFTFKFYVVFRFLGNTVKSLIESRTRSKQRLLTTLRYFPKVKKQHKTYILRRHLKNILISFLRSSAIFEIYVSDRRSKLWNQCNGNYSRKTFNMHGIISSTVHTYM